MKEELVHRYFTDSPESGRVQLFRSMLAGAIATVADMGTLILLKEATPLSEHTVVATTIAFIIGLIVNYLLSTFWAFRGLNSKKRSTEFIVFCIISVIGLLLNDAIVWFFEHVLAEKGTLDFIIPQGKYYIFGKLIATLLVFIWNFGMRKILLYRGSGKAGADHDSDESPRK